MKVYCEKKKEYRDKKRHFNRYIIGISDFQLNSSNLGVLF